MTLDVAVTWRRERGPRDDAVRARVVWELRAVAWSLSEFQAMLHEAHRATAAEHAYLLPRMEARLPLFEDGLRYRVVLSQVDEPKLTLVDESDRVVADITLL